MKCWRGVYGHGKKKKDKEVFCLQVAYKEVMEVLVSYLVVILGLQVKQKEYGIFISQDKYVTEILKKFSFSDVKTASTPMETYKPLLKDADGEDVDEHLYRSMIGSLMYLTSSRPDIMFAVCACARFQVNPKILHLYAVKRIFRYLKGQPKLGLWYPKDSPFVLVAFTDSDYARASLDRKSTTRGCQFLGGLYTKDDWNGMQKLLRMEFGLKLFWTTAKTKIVNNETQIHAKVEGKTIVILESSVRRDLQFDDEDVICLATNQKFNFSKLIFDGMMRNLDSSKKFLMYPRFLQLFLNKQIENLSEVNAVYDTPSHTKKIFANMRRQGKDFLGTVTPLFSSMLTQQADIGEGSGQPTDLQHTSTYVQPSNEEPITVPSSSQPKKTHRSRKDKRATEISQFSGPIPLVADETVTKERENRMKRAATTTSTLEAEQDSGNINRVQSMATLNEPSPQGTGLGSGPRCQDTILGDAEAQTRIETASKQSNDPPLSRVNTLGSGEDRLKLKELIDLYTKLSDRVLDLETIKTAQAKEIASLKKRVRKLERKRKSKTPWMNLFKIGTSRRRSLDTVEEGEVQVPTADMEVNTASAPVTTTGVSVSTAEPITTASVNITTAKPITPPTTKTVFEDKDLIIAQTLMKMRSEKSKVRGVVMQEPSETVTRPTVPPQQHDPKDKGNGKMVEQEKPLKKKDQIKFNEEIAQRLQAQMQAELEEEERLAREREEDANIAKCDNVQAMMDSDYDLAARIHAQEQEELTISFLS
ncbi:hypothetical protein Tco_0150260 [Tanacetum coccineum]